MMARLKRASLISEANITPIYIDDELIQIEVKSRINTYLVSCKSIYKDNANQKQCIPTWRCNCKDFGGRGVNNSEGSFLCKHCLAGINFLMNKDPEMVELMILENEGVDNV